jgi:hypothetical protein
MKEIAGTYWETTKIPIGSKIKFYEEKQKYTIRASNVAFAICTKPMNALHTVLYTIIDWGNNIRGTENLIFGLGVETDKECREMLKRLTEGKTEVSSRNNIKLNIEKIDVCE